MGGLGMTEYLLVAAMQLVPLGTVFYLAWRLVRALERRKGANVQVLDLVQQVRALRTEVTMLSGELSGLDAVRGVATEGSRAERSTLGSAS